MSVIENDKEKNAVLFCYKQHRTMTYEESNALLSWHWVDMEVRRQTHALTLLLCRKDSVIGVNFTVSSFREQTEDTGV